MSAIVRLSPHLTLAEFTHTRHLQFLDEQARPPADVFANGQRLARIAFEPAHELCGRLYVTSGWRCVGLNESVGGRPNSAHLDGRALDMVPLDWDLLTAFTRIAASDIPFDELIWEHGRWIHIQVARGDWPERRLVLMTFDGRTYEPFDPSDRRVLRDVV